MSHPHPLPRLHLHTATRYASHPRRPRRPRAPGTERMTRMCRASAICDLLGICTPGAQGLVLCAPPARWAQLILEHSTRYLQSRSAPASGPAAPPAQPGASPCPRPRLHNQLPQARRRACIQALQAHARLPQHQVQALQARVQAKGEVSWALRSRTTHGLHAQGAQAGRHHEHCLLDWQAVYIGQTQALHSPVETVHQLGPQRGYCSASTPPSGSHVAAAKAEAHTPGA